jgi:hypothetical protein
MLLGEFFTDSYFSIMALFSCMCGVGVVMEEIPSPDYA